MTNALHSLSLQVREGTREDSLLDEHVEVALSAEQLKVAIQPLMPVFRELLGITRTRNRRFRLAVQQLEQLIGAGAAGQFPEHSSPMDGLHIE